MNSLDLFQQLAVSLLPLLLALTVPVIVQARVALALGDTTGKQYDRTSLNPLSHADPIGTLVVPGAMIALGNLAGSGGGLLIGWAKPLPISYRNFRDPRGAAVKLAGAGLAAKFLLALAWAFVFRATYGATEGVELGVALMARQGITISLSFFVLNLLPLPPFAVGNMLLVTLPPKQAQQLESIQPYTFIIILVLAVTGLFGVIFQPLFSLLRDLILTIATLF
ncbi:site-2 protease family protein [Nevskia sp.]|uniref:site-2 protease family protein n=1 Tax=Nevskia sp. TaxID=1929292 RepID=UPI0025FE9FB3|nr:site-2 protease family protein [Nevskia sp.]